MTDATDSPGVAITGIGAVCCAGAGVDQLWQAVIQRDVSAEWLEETPNGTLIAGCRAGPPTVHGVRERDFARMDPFAQLGLAAGQQAWTDAGLAAADIDPRRIAVISGTSRGPVATRHSGGGGSRRRVRPTEAVYSSVSSLTGALGTAIGARGPSMTVSATCASSAVALDVAAQQIRTGRCDVALVGGADAPLHPDLVAEMHAAGVFGTADDPRHVCRPFDVRRTGIIIGEAAAFLVLESFESAQTRGARVRATLAGSAACCDVGHRSGMSPDARGLRDALQAALADAGCNVDDVDAVHLHGTGTATNDAAEAAIVRELFGDRADRLPCTSTKAVTGHCLGASGALQAVINVRALEEQCLPPTANCEQLDPDCRIAVVRDSPWHGELRTILTHSAGFWGNHAGLLFRQA